MNTEDWSWLHRNQSPENGYDVDRVFIEEGVGKKGRPDRTLHSAAQRHLKVLSNLKQRLVEAFVYEHAVYSLTYQEQLDKLNEEIAPAKINERDVRIEEMYGRRELRRTCSAQCSTSLG